MAPTKYSPPMGMSVAIVSQRDMGLAKEWDPLVKGTNFYNIRNMYVKTSLEEN